MRINNKVKSMYNRLLKDGYYLKPKKFKNCTIVQLTKDFSNYNGRSIIRFIFCELNITTAKKLSNLFGFKIKNGEECFGIAVPIKNDYKRQYTNH